MTTNDKAELLAYIKNCSPTWSMEVYDDDLGQYKTFPCYAVADVESAINEMMEESDRKSQRDYEAEYNRMVELVTNMEREVNRWKDVATHHEEELKRLRLIIKTIEFVAGRKLDI